MNKKYITVIAIAIIVIGIGITLSYVIPTEDMPETTLEDPENVEPTHYSVTLSESAQVNSP